MKKSTKSTYSNQNPLYSPEKQKDYPLLNPDIDFNALDLADLLALNISVTAPPEKKPKEKYNSNSIFSKKTTKNTKKLFSLDQRVASTPRDIKLELLSLNPTIYPINTLNEISKAYINKILLFSAMLCTSIGILEIFNIAAQHFLNFSLSTYFILGTSTLLNILGITSLHLYNTKKTKKAEAQNPKILAEKNPILETIRDQLCQAYNTPIMLIEVMLKPTILIQKTRNKSVLRIGIPLLQKLNNQELLALLSYHFQYHCILQKNRLGHFFWGITQNPLQLNLDASHTWTQKIFHYPLKQMHNSIMQAATLGAIDATNLETVISAYTKNILLLNSFQKFLIEANKGDLIPINVVTQILCTMEHQDIRCAVECSHIKEKVKTSISSIADTLEPVQQPLTSPRNYPSQWLLATPNLIANNLSKSFFKNLNFSPEQLQKTHASHQSFSELSNVDAIQNYYAGFYRLNRSIYPNLLNGDAGSLLSLKIEINNINQQIKIEAPQFIALIQEWDQHTAPNYIRAMCNTPEGAALEKVHHNLLVFESLLAKKSGLCLAITLSIANPQEQQNLYNLLRAHRQCVNLHRIMDSTLHHLITYRTSVTSSALCALHKNLQTLMDICKSLPRLDCEIETENSHQLFTLLDEIPKNVDLINPEVLPKVAQHLIVAVDQYRWATDRALTQTCIKVEERLNIQRLTINL